MQRSVVGCCALPATSMHRTLRPSQRRRDVFAALSGFARLAQAEEMLQWQRELRDAVRCRPNLLDPAAWTIGCSLSSLQRSGAEVSVWEKEALFSMASEVRLRCDKPVMTSIEVRC